MGGKGKLGSLNKTFYSFGGKSSLGHAHKNTDGHAYMSQTFSQHVENQRKQQTNFSGRSSM